MALRTAGTSATTSLLALLVGTDDLNPANIAQLLTGSPAPGVGLRTDIPVVNTALLTGIPRNLVNGGYTQTGTLIVPGRGVLIAKPGDFVLLDQNTGWPLLLSGDAAANGTWVHT